MSQEIAFLYNQYNYVAHEEEALENKVTKIIERFSIQNDSVPLSFLGILYDFMENDPQRYFKQNVADEVFNQLDDLYKINDELFAELFYEYQYQFIYSINSYKRILELYDEFDDISFESDIKTSIYTLPLLTQTMEYCLNHFYRGLVSIIGGYKGKDYTLQTKLGQLKNILKNEFPTLVDIDIDFRNAISHGSLHEISDGFYNKFTYETKQDSQRGKGYQDISLEDINKMKYEYLDISSGALLGLIKFLAEKNIVNEALIERSSEEIQLEYLKLFFHNQNIKIKSFSKAKVESTQLSIHLSVKRINDLKLIQYAASIIILPPFVKTTF